MSIDSSSGTGSWLLPINVATMTTASEMTQKNATASAMPVMLWYFVCRFFIAGRGLCVLGFNKNPVVNT